MVIKKYYLESLQSKNPMDSFYGTYIILILTAYQSVAVSALRIFDCALTLQTDGTDIHILQVEPSIICNQGSHVWMKSLAIVSIIIYLLGIPVITALLLYRYRNEISIDQSFN